MLEKMGIDERDARIISWYAEDPSVSQSEIAKRLRLSQPSVNARIQKLIKRGLLSSNTGLRFSASNLFMMRVDFTATYPGRILAKLKQCSFFVNGFVMSGKNNVSVFLVCDDLRKIDEIINAYIRDDPSASDINTNVVVSSAKDFVFALNFTQELHRRNCTELNTCKDCSILARMHQAKAESLKK
jgi:Lrp/AsnC family leucine-responsive transcriptional regulator